jgi:fructose-1,6-bisphosphatase/inositol monophosphatase family enzyme
MAYVATGWFDVAINVWGNYYDNAPIKLIVEEAGGTVTTLSGGAFGKDDPSMIVSNGIVHQAVLDTLK